MEKSETSDRNVSDGRLEDPVGKSILDLNQHCLLEVFSYLDVYDAIHFGETCKSLQTVSRLAMIKYKNFDLILHQECLRSRQVPAWSNLPPHPPLEKVMSYVAPYIESLDARTELIPRSDSTWTRDDQTEMRKRAEPLHTFLQFDMPKLKSLTIQYSDHLVYILDRASINELTIYKVHPNDLNVYANGLRNLKQLHLISIHKRVSIEEISPILEHNPNIEDLCLVYEAGIFGQHEFPRDFVQKLPRLKRLELSIGSTISEIWESIQQLQELSELALVMRYDHRYLNNFLKQLSEKDSVKSIELKGGNFFEDGGRDLLDTLASMNLHSLTLESSTNSIFNSVLTRAKFHTLNNLQLSILFDIDMMMLIIERFESLKRLVVRVMALKCNSSTLSRRITQLFEVTPTTRPDLEVNVLTTHSLVKICFRHATYDIISWVETFETFETFEETWTWSP